MSRYERKDRRWAKIFLYRELMEYFGVSRFRLMRVARKYDLYTVKGAIGLVKELLDGGNAKDNE